MSTIDVLDSAPHFEKMLYDKAQLARVYLHAWQVTGEPFCRTIAEETLDYAVREMRLAMGEDLTHIIRRGPVRPIAPMEEVQALPAKL